MDHFINLLTIAGFLGAAGAFAEEPLPLLRPLSLRSVAAERSVLRLATTTSVADSGLAAAILPDFEQRYGCRVDVIAVGTGQALSIASRGDADVVIVHAQEQEEAFIAAGHAKQRHEITLRTKLPESRVVFGGERPEENRDAALINRYAVMAVDPAKHPTVNAVLAERLVAWLRSAEIQRRIGQYGVDRFGQPLFHPAAR